MQKVSIYLLCVFWQGLPGMVDDSCSSTVKNFILPAAAVVVHSQEVAVEDIVVTALLLGHIFKADNSEV